MQNRPSNQTSDSSYKKIMARRAGGLVSRHSQDNPGDYDSDGNPLTIDAAK